MTWSCSVSLYRHALDRVPRPRTVSWPALCASLTRRRVVAGEDKRQCPAWSPARYPDGATRASRAVLDLSCVVLDLDDGAHAGEALAAYADWPHVVHTTWSHTPDAPRLRLVVPLEVPVPVALWPRAWAWAHRRAGLVADPKCRDPARLYFLHAVRAEDWPGYAEVHDPGGGLLDLRPFDALPVPAEERRAAAQATRRPPQRRAGPIDRQMQVLLNSDPESRRRACEALGGHVAGELGAEAARGVTCPQCGQPSVWWPISPRRGPKAMCHHRRSCGWMGFLDTLFPAADPR